MNEHTAKRINDPEIRKNQILEAAMQLFCEKGYDNTSLDDIAEKLHIVKGLCYRYFPSKQILFNAVLDEYTDECCQPFIKIITDKNQPAVKRLTEILTKLFLPEENGRLHAFFHKSGNESFHGQLSLNMCRYLLPYVSSELSSGGCEHSQILAQFLLYGLFGIWQENAAYSPAIISQFENIAAKALS